MLNINIYNDRIIILSKPYRTDIDLLVNITFTDATVSQDGPSKSVKKKTVNRIKSRLTRCGYQTVKSQLVSF